MPRRGGAVRRAMSPTLGLVAVALHPVATAAGAPPGCFVTNWLYTKPLTTGALTAESAEGCQAICAKTPECEVFSYWVAPQPKCSLGGAASRIDSSPTDGVVSGPKSCTSPPQACSAMPVSEWPRGTEGAVMANWSTGYQPQKDQCFNGYGTVSAKCPDVSILDSISAVWPGQCHGLVKVDNVPQGISCEDACKQNVACPGYELAADGSCWHGLGRDCFTGGQTGRGVPKEAKRFQRGSIRVIRNMTHLSLTNLETVFGPGSITSMSQQGGQPLPARQCANVCYSLVGCEYWQLDTRIGCRIENPANGHTVTYPLSSSAVSWDAASVADIVAGEYIQRRCDSSYQIYTPSLLRNLAALDAVTPTTTSSITTISPTTTSSITTTSTTKEEAVPFPLWAWLFLGRFMIGALILVSCLAGIALCTIWYRNAKSTTRSVDSDREALQELPEMEDTRSYQPVPQLTPTPSFSQPGTARQNPYDPFAQNPGRGISRAEALAALGY